MKKRLKKEENHADICRFSGEDHRIFTAKITLKKRKTVVKIDSKQTKKRLEKGHSANLFYAVYKLNFRGFVKRFFERKSTKKDFAPTPCFDA